MANFQIPGRTPFDRYFIAPVPPTGGLPPFFLTVGAHSYSSTINFVTDSATSAVMTIGRYTSIASELTIMAGMNHIYKNCVTHYPFDAGALVNDFNSYGKKYLVNDIPHSRRLDNHYQIIIGNEVWIGMNVTINAGVKIGNGAIIGSNSFVAKDVPPYAIAVGNPARVVKYRFDEETIKKLLALRWWNWDIDKVCANVHKMYDVEKFLAEHYRPELELVPQDELGQEAEKYRAEGRDVYTFIADFRSPHPVWRRVLSGILSSKLKDAVLFFFIGHGATDKDLAELQNFPNTMEKIVSMPIIKCITPVGGAVFSPHVLRTSTHFITNREMVTTEALDWLWGTNVKIISALDEGIFDGEPLVDWNKFS